ncbi:hypothetical protein SEA_TDANISKY_81 [Mycobacterium phage TDanisky]|nr:hypothetical protein SEA_TDANISKY_81 [Mycobacterium phage TDanisky]
MSAGDKGEGVKVAPRGVQPPQSTTGDK